ncbi:MAG TPA: extracellular solute-binding protein [Roseiflexaceae bacterium]|nr:extracellular solute-binding protein [Roseiflexaceae bacterium]
MSKRMSRRTFLTASGGGLVLASAAALLGGGAIDPSGGARRVPLGGTPGVRAASGALAIRYWSALSGRAARAEQAMVEAFNRSQGAVRVVLEHRGGYADTARAYATATRNGGAPDLVMLSDTAWFSLQRAALLAPLDRPAADAEIVLGDFAPGLLNEGLHERQRFWLPYARSTPLFFYNADAWARAGLPERGPATWQEFQAWAPRLTGGGRAAFGHPQDASTLSWLFQSVIWQFGGAYSTPDLRPTLAERHSLRAAQFYRDSVHDAGWARFSPDLRGDFLAGRVRSMLASSSALADVGASAGFRVGGSALPRESFGATLTGGAGLSLAAGADPERQTAAMRYVAFATSPANAARWTEATGALPLRLSAQERPELRRLLSERPGLQTALDQLGQARPQDGLRTRTPAGDALIGAGLLRILAGGEPAKVWQDVAARLEPRG